MNWRLVPASSFDAHAREWDALQARTTCTPFLESAFMLPLLQQFGDGTERLALLQDATGLHAATLLRPRGRGMWETFQPSQLPLGPWIGEQDVLPDALGKLIRTLPGLALGFGVTQLDPKLVPRPERSDICTTLDYIHTSHIDIAGTFDAYWETRGKNLRQNTRKQRNKLQAEGTTTVLECLTDPKDVAAALLDYGTLEAAGWKAGTGTAIEANNDQGRFYQQMLQNFCALGRGRIYRYRFGDKVVAMDLCIDNGPMVVILKTTYDESYKQISPSTLMRQEQFNAFWDEGRYQRIEFYGKTLEWHTRWTETGRTLFHVTQYRWGWVAQLAARRNLKVAITQAA